MDNTAKTATEASKVLSSLSPGDFQLLGLHHIAYIKPVVLNDRMAWSVYAADGTSMSVHLTEQAAAAAARQNHLFSVHTH